MTLHPDRYSTSGVIQPKGGVIVHDSEGGEGGIASAVLVKALEQKGDRDNGHGGVYGAGYHAVATETGGYIQVATAAMGPYAAPPLNKNFWHVCIPGRAAQTRDQWLDGPSFAYIQGVAKFIVDRWHEDGQRWALDFNDASALRAGLGSAATAAGTSRGAVGYSSHAQVSQAWHETDHTDPGVSFPWDVLATEIAKLVQPAPIPPPTPIPPTTGGLVYYLISIAGGTAFQNAAVFGGLGTKGKDGRVLIPIVEWMQGADEANYAPSAERLTLNVTDLKGVTLLGPNVPPGYNGTEFRHYNG